MKMSSHEKRWQTEGDVDALQRAAEVQSDPKRHAAAQKHAKQQLKEHDAKRARLERVVSKKLKDAFPKK